MSKTKISAPVEGYTGVTYVGPHVLKFENGAAEVEDLSDGARLYLSSNGYGIDGASAESVTDDGPEPVDPRKVDGEASQVGSKLRDAAVDPEPGDFLAPTNAGKANPHGPDVVSPELHASQGVRPVKGGDVHVDDVAAQDDAEKAHAEASTDGTSVPGTEAAAELKGAALDDALEEAGLSKSGTADEKRARLAEHRGEA